MKAPLPFAGALRSGGALLKHLSKVTPKSPKLTIGLDIGSSAVKVIVLGPRKALGGRAVIGQQLSPVRQADEAEIASVIKEAIGTLALPTKAVTLSVSGQWVIMRVLEMPAVSPTELQQALPFEAQRYLPFNIQDVVLDGAVLAPAEGNKVWVLVVACKRDLLERRINWVRQAGFEPSVIDVDALALVNAFLEQANGHKASGTHALINVGSQWTNLAVLKDGVPYLVRDVPWGAEKLTRQLADQLGLDEAAVSSQLTQQVALTPQLIEAVKVACETLVADLQLSFDFFENRFGPPPEQLMMSGGVAQQPVFLEALKAHLTQPVVPWTPGGGLSSQFAIAYGLALRTP